MKVIDLSMYFAIIRGNDGSFPTYPGGYSYSFKLLDDLILQQTLILALVISIAFIIQKYASIYHIDAPL